MQEANVPEFEKRTFHENARERKAVQCTGPAHHGSDGRPEWKESEERAQSGKGAPLEAEKTLCAGTRFVHRHGAALERLPVKVRDRRPGLASVMHLDKAEAFGFAADTVFDDGGRVHRTVFLKSGTQCGFGEIA